MDDDTEPPMDGPDASDGDGADASDAGEPRLILNSHRALDAIGGFVNPSDIRALRVVSKTVRDSRGHRRVEPLRPRPRQLAGHQGLRRGQLESGRAGRSREEPLPLP